MSLRSFSAKTAHDLISQGAILIGIHAADERVHANTSLSHATFPWIN